jgi:adenylate cyclase
MRSTKRSRREWQVFLWLSIASATISAGFGYLIGNHTLHSAVMGILHSIAIATPILLFEIKAQDTRLLRRLRRQPLLVYFGFRILFYVAVIVGGIVVVRLLFDDSPTVFDETFRPSIVFAVTMSVGANLVFEMGSLLGFGTLRNLLTGRYVQPRREQRAFVLIDMKDSTGMAERLGPVRFHELLNAFFQNVADAALECEGEIHKYVGDEAILTWSGDAIAGGDYLACPFAARDAIEADRQRYLKRFGVVPSFRAAIHCGEVVAGEIGDVRREIAFVGDTLNVAARLLEAAKTLGHDILASADVLARATLPASLRADRLPTLSIRGRVAPLGIAALEQA